MLVSLNGFSVSDSDIIERNVGNSHQLLEKKIKYSCDNMCDFYHNFLLR